jgi:hypothetical protein
MKCSKGLLQEVESFNNVIKMANFYPDLPYKIMEVTDNSIWEKFKTFHGNCLPEPERTNFFNKIKKIQRKKKKDQENLIDPDNLIDPPDPEDQVD